MVAVLSFCLQTGKRIQLWRGIGGGMVEMRVREVTRLPVIPIRNGCVFR